MDVMVLVPHDAAMNDMQDRPDGLMRATPSSRGVDARGIEGFLDAAAADGLELHGMMLFRGGAVVAEGYWQPYAAHRPHMLHSAVKSWTGTAVGLAVGDGLLRLEDRVVSFFPALVPDPVSENLALMTVKDLLTMRSGHRTGISGGEWRWISGSWVEAFLREPVPDRPGTAFIYSSGSSYMLSAIVTAVTGKTVHALLEERVFRPLGVTSAVWDVSPEGYSTGGNGLSCTLEDVLKFGVLHLQDGVWDGVRILPAGWVAEATRSHVDDVWIGQMESGRYPARDAASNVEGEKREGYGYQFWMMPAGAYRASGMFGQQCIVLPGQDAVLAVTAGLRPEQKSLLAQVARHIIPALGVAGADEAADDALAERLASLALPVPAGAASTAVRAEGRFSIEPNEDGVEAVAFTFTPGQCRFSLWDQRGCHVVDAGVVVPLEGETTMTGAKLHHAYQPERMRVVASGVWTDPDCFCMTWRFVETAFCDTVMCQFDGESVRLERSVNTNAGAMTRPALVGKR